MPTKRKQRPMDPHWFSKLPDEALIREAQILPTPGNHAPLIDAGKATFHRWVRDGIAPRPIKLGGTSNWQVGALRHWLRTGEVRP